MNLQQRKDLFTKLGQYMQSNDEDWQGVKHKAYAENRWFIPEFIDLAVQNIATNYLQPSQLQQLIDQYQVPGENSNPKRIGIVMAGNIPLVGFHDMLCVFVTGHYAIIKPSSKDEVLVTHLVKKLTEWTPEAAAYLKIEPMLKGCDAYIATGSNNTAKHFEYYFRNHPSIIRRNRTSVAILTGHESNEELEKLADDVYQYFGLGCRNVTKIYVPEGYDFVPLLQAFRKWNHLADFNKYKNNYDYNLAVHILNNRYYMSNDSLLLIEDPSLFSPIGQLHYEFYTDEEAVKDQLKGYDEVQCVVSASSITFGRAQCPQVCDYADGVDTMQFLLNLS